jgi:hypothetical protein
MRAILGLCVFSLCTGAAGADDPLATRSGWEVGGLLSSYHYEEPGFMWLEGDRFGVTGAYTATNEKHAFGRIEARWSYGELEYQGSGTLDGVPDQLLEVRMLAGRDYPRGSVAWSPYVGAAFRYLYNDLRGTTSTGAAGYRRESFYFYVPLGVTLRMPLGGSWVLAPQLEYKAFVHGVQRTYLSDTGLGLSDFSNQQSQGSGYRAQLMFEGPRWSIGLWTDYWDVKDSDVQSAGAGIPGMEPANWTRETGVELRYRF